MDNNWQGWIDAVGIRIQRLFALEEGGVGVVKSAVERVGRKVAEIFVVELAQGADEGAGLIHGLPGEGVGFVFMAARPPMGQR